MFEGIVMNVLFCFIICVQEQVLLVLFLIEDEDVVCVIVWIVDECGMLMQEIVVLVVQDYEYCFDLCEKVFERMFKFWCEYFLFFFIGLKVDKVFYDGLLDDF